MIRLLYTSDNAGQTMLVTSLLSVVDVIPDAEIYIHFTEDEFNIPPIVRYTKVELTPEQKAWADQYPTMNRQDGRIAPRTTFFKIPALYSLPDDIDDVLYLDIDTVIVKDPSSIFDELGEDASIGAALSLGSLKARQPFNAGVMAFRRHNLPEGFDKAYHEAVIASEGKYGDQEVYAKIGVKSYIVSPIYNSRRMLSGTKIIHASGKKPFESYPEALGLDQDAFERLRDKLVAQYKQSGERLRLGKGNPEGAFYYLDYFRRAFSWRCQTDPSFDHQTFINSLHRLGCSCCN